MRRAWLLALLALAVADPALADITARFRQPDGPPIVVQVNDRGDSRMAVTDGVYLSRNGDSHMILTFRGGTVVARREDFLAVLAEFSGAQTPSAPASGRPELSEAGRETVGGRVGTVYRLGDAGRADSVDFVLSTDADLAPIGRVFRAQFLPMLAAQGSSSQTLVEMMTDLLSRGTLLRFGGLFQLEAIDTTPVPASAFDLPGAPMSRDALRERILGEASR